MEMISPKIVKDIEKAPFRSESRDFCQFLEGVGNSFGENGFGKKSLGFGFGKFGLGKKLSVLVPVKILVSSFSGWVVLCWAVLGCSRL